MKISFIIPSNDEKVLMENALNSPCLKNSEVIVQKGYSRPGKAFNDAIDKAKGDILIFMHQDLYLPGDWDKKILAQIKELEKKDPAWAVCGTFGMDTKNKYYGHICSNGLGIILGENNGIRQAKSLDEVILILKKKADLRFDENLPGYHYYGTDICMIAEDRGFNSYIIPLFSIHNSTPVVLKNDFWTCFEYMKLKWEKKLPFVTTCSSVNRNIISYLRQRLDALKINIRNTKRRKTFTSPLPEEILGRLQKEDEQLSI